MRVDHNSTIGYHCVKRLRSLILARTLGEEAFIIVRIYEAISKNKRNTGLLCTEDVAQYPG